MATAANGTMRRGLGKGCPGGIGSGDEVGEDADAVVRIRK
jgi:hypothetical protein